MTENQQAKAVIDEYERGKVFGTLLIKFENGIAVIWERSLKDKPKPQSDVRVLQK